MKLRWYSIEPFGPASLRQIAERMKSEAFSNDSDVGFLIDNFSKTKIGGRFIKREKVSRKVEDPFGAERLVEFDQYAATAFSFSTKIPNLELVDPPSKLTEFISYISRFLDFKCAIKPVSADVSTWLNLLNVQGTTLRVVKLTTEAVSLSSEILVKAAFGGTTDVRSAVKRLFPKGDVKAETVNAVIRVAGTEVRFRLNSEGFSFTDEPDETLKEMVVNAAREIAETTAVRG